MKKIESKILDDVYAKYQIKFPNIANSKYLLTRTYHQFKNRKRPKLIVNQKNLKNQRPLIEAARSLPMTNLMTQALLGGADF